MLLLNCKQAGGLIIKNKKKVLRANNMSSISKQVKNDKFKLSLETKFCLILI